MKCLYHSADLDGKCSAAIVRENFLDCEMIGINYGQAFPWDRIIPGETVYMVDFCLQPFEDMEKLNKMVDLVWIDHHETAIDEAERRGFEASSGTQVLEVGVAACELTWIHLMQRTSLTPKPMPLSVSLIGAYDVWKWQSVEGAQEFQYGMRMYDSGPLSKVWDSLMFDGDDFTKGVIAKAGIIVDYVKVDNEDYIKDLGFEIELGGLKCIAVNKGHASSQLFDSIYDPEKYDAMVTFVRLKNGLWTVSLYTTKPNVDVGKIAKKRGGGGHKQAAGFQCKKLPF